MRIRRAAAASIICLVPVAQGASRSSPARRRRASRCRPRSADSGETPTLKARMAEPGDAQVTIRQWTIPPKQKVDSLPERGFLLVTVRAGKVTTIINGQQQQRSTDDFWTVPANSKMSVEASGEAALLEVLSLTVR